MSNSIVKQSWRFFTRRKLYFLVNLLGLAMGIAFFLLMSLYAWQEFSFDNWHEKSDRIYRVEKGSFQVLGPAYGPILKDKSPFVEEFVRFYLYNPLETYYMRGDEKIPVDHFVFTDPNIGDVFDLNLLYGSKKHCLEEPFTIVISETLSSKLFGEEDPMGKQIFTEEDIVYEITGVFEDWDLSHIQIHALTSMESLVRLKGLNNFDGMFDPHDFPTYILVDNGGSDEGALEEGVKNALRTPLNEVFGKSGTDGIRLTSLENVYFEGKSGKNILAGKRKVVLILFSASLLLLLVACANYVNLSTALGIERAKEIGIRKVMGAKKQNLRQQFIAESVLLTALAFILALGMVELSMPFFNRLAPTGLYNGFYSQPLFWVGLILGVFAIGLLAGVYPAFFLSKMSSFNSMQMGFKINMGKGATFRKILTVFQFFISAALILMTLVVFQQLNHFRNQPTGFQKENLLYVQLPSRDSSDMQLFKAQTAQLAAIQNSTFISAPLGATKMYSTWHIDGKKIRHNMVFTDHAFDDIFQVELLEGSFFNENDVNSELWEYVINERAKRALGIQGNAAGRIIKTKYREFKINGVIKDIHHKSFREEITPMAIRYVPSYRMMVLKLSPGNKKEVESEIQKIFEVIYPDANFISFYQDQYLKDLYKKEEKLGTMFLWFSIITALIAIMGLFALSLFTVRKRTREIAIRKVNGAMPGEIIKLLGVDFTKWVLLGVLLSWPVSYYLIEMWLQQFAYGTAPGILPFLRVLIFVLFLSWITVAIHVYFASRLNPAKALKYE